MKRLSYLLFAVLLSSCGEPPRDVVVPFRATLDGASIGCDRRAGGVTLTDLRFYVSDVRLVRRDGRQVPVVMAPRGRWQSADIALIDLEDGSAACVNGTPDVNDRIVGTAPAGDYTGLVFTVGVPFDANHADPLGAAPPLDDSTMHWHWRSGYKFLRAGWSGERGVFWLHLGSAGCEGTVGAIVRCSYPNRIDVRIADFAPGDRIAVDLRALVESVSLASNEPASCSSGPGDEDCRAPFTTLGIDWQSGRRVGEPQLFASEPG